MSDYIRRQDAKDALQEKVFHNLTDEFYGAMQAIDELPPADVVEVKHGEWISECEPHYECSECHHWFHLYQHMNFCPNCGAKMDSSRRKTMPDCTKCKFAVWGYETYYCTKKKQWFVDGCKKDLDEDDCEEFEEEEA